MLLVITLLHFTTSIHFLHFTTRLHFTTSNIDATRNHSTAFYYSHSLSTLYYSHSLYYQQHRYYSHSLSARYNLQLAFTLCALLLLVLRAITAAEWSIFHMTQTCVISSCLSCNTSALPSPCPFPGACQKFSKVSALADFLCNVTLCGKYLLLHVTYM